MTLQQLHYVVEIADKGSMNEAAKSLYVAQPTLSATIRELEKELGFPLFVRNNRGMVLSVEGMEFLTYARSILEQENALKRRYFSPEESKSTLAVSCQHYGFVTEGFLALLREIAPENYSFSLKEKRTEAVIADVKGFRSEIGIIYTHSKTQRMMRRYLKENHLEFVPICETKAHVLLNKSDPLAKEKSLRLEQLEEYTYLYFDQQGTDPIYFSEEIISNRDCKKKIGVSDRATIFSFLNSMQSYTITTGMACRGSVEGKVVAIPLEIDVSMEIGYIKLENAVLRPLTQRFIDELKKVITNML